MSKTLMTATQWVEQNREEAIRLAIEVQREDDQKIAELLVATVPHADSSPTPYGSLVTRLVAAIQKRILNESTGE